MDRPGLATVPADAFYASLDRWARERPASPALHFVEDLQGSTSTLSFAEVAELERRGASALASAGASVGDRVLLDLPTGPAFVAAILGALRIGAVPASVAPMAQRRGEAAEAEWQHHVEATLPRVIATAGEVPATASITVLQAEAMLTGAAEEAPERVDPAGMRYVQFSSGSTGSPKALVLGMPGIAFNLERMRELIPIHDDDHIVSWLPMYHDMGLFGTLLLALHTGCQLTLMDPSLFARSPLLWFTSIERAGGRITVGPPSAMKASFELLKRRPPESLDLSQCSRWICGSEQVTPELIAQYHEVLGPYGAPREGLKPVYGMAEITLTATLPPLGRGQVVEYLDRRRFEQDHLAVIAEQGERLGWTGVGRILRDQQVQVTGDAGQPLPDGQVGHILLDSPSLFVGTLQGEEFTPRAAGWHDTGDLGYLRGEELFITGRARELIIKNGRNYAPERIEELASTVEGVGRGAAYGVFDADRQTERAELIVEVHPRVLGDPAQRDGVRLAVRQALARASYELDAVRLCARGSLPRTTSGKIRRSACRAFIEAQEGAA